MASEEEILEILKLGLNTTTLGKRYGQGNHSDLLLSMVGTFLDLAHLPRQPKVSREIRNSQTQVD